MIQACHCHLLPCTSEVIGGPGGFRVVVYDDALSVALRALVPVVQAGVIDITPDLPDPTPLSPQQRAEAIGEGRSKARSHLLDELESASRGALWVQGHTAPDDWVARVSLSHRSTRTAYLVAPRGKYDAIGVDLERFGVRPFVAPADVMPEGLPGGRPALEEALIGFSVKEALYKAGSSNSWGPDAFSDVRLAWRYDGDVVICSHGLDGVCAVAQIVGPWLVSAAWKPREASSARVDVNSFTPP